MTESSKSEDPKMCNPLYMIDSIPKFTGDDVTYSSVKWTQDIEDNAEIFEWSQQQKLIIARRCLSGTAELWLKTEKAFRTYDELKAALLKEFPEAINSKQMHEMMSARKKKANETYYQYMLVMKELGKRAKFPDYVAIQYIIDGYTKFVWIYPVKTVTAKETIEKLKLHQKDYGNPRKIITDRGTALTGNEFREYCHEEEIEHVTIATGVPRGNGQVERMNRIIISILTKMCIEELGLWYKYVSKVQRVINGTHQRAINTTPFELLTGVKLRMKEDMKILEFLEEENRMEFMQKRDEARREAKAQILKIQEENQRTYNKKRKEGEQYSQGDLVAIQRTQFGNALKLKPKFYGPYRVTKELGRDRYEVEKIDRGKEGPIRTTSAVDCMKRWP